MSRARLAIGLSWLGLLVACGGGVAGPGRATIGPQGGTVRHSSGAAIVVPPGALDGPVELALEATEPPSGLPGPAATKAFHLTPDGQTFKKPVQVVLPSSGEPAGLAVFTAPSGSSELAELPTFALDGQVMAQTVHFSVFVGARLAVLRDLEPPTLDPAVVDVAYAVALVAPTDKTWQFAVTTGALPPGLSLSSGGAVTGTPTAVGVWGFAVTATEPGGGRLERAYALVVQDANAQPVLDSLTPSTAAAGASSLVITLGGFGFAAGATVKWDGAVLPSTQESSLHLTATVDAVRLGGPATHQVTVSNPSGATSNPMAFVVTGMMSGNAPNITSVTPTTIAAGSGDTILMVTGENFATGSHVKANGKTLVTTYLGPTRLDAVLPAAQLASVGQLDLTVDNGLAGVPIYVDSPSLLVLATGQPSPHNPLVVGGYLYFATWDAQLHRSLRRVPIGGGAAEVIVDNADSDAVASDGTYLYWSLAYGGPPYGCNLNRVALAGGTPEPVLSRATTNCYAFLLEGSKLWIVDNAKLATVNTDGTGFAYVNVTTSLPGATTSVEGMALDASNVYLSYADANGQVFAQPRNGSQGATLATALAYPRGLVVDGGTVYAAVSSAMQIVSFPTTAGGTVTPLATLQGMPRQLVREGNNLFWAAGGVVQTMPMPSGTPTTLAIRPDVQQVAVDATYVYYLRGTAGEIVRVTR